MKPKVYIRMGPKAAIIGPAGAWQVDDEVEIYSRPAGTMDKGDPGSQGFLGLVVGVDEDGLARVCERADD